jgi:hypothetical protein
VTGTVPHQQDRSLANQRFGGSSQFKIRSWSASHRDPRELPHKGRRSPKLLVGPLVCVLGARSGGQVIARVGGVPGQGASVDVGPWGRQAGPRLKAAFGTRTGRPCGGAHVHLDSGGRRDREACGQVVQGQASVTLRLPLGPPIQPFGLRALLRGVRILNLPSGIVALHAQI